MAEGGEGKTVIAGCLALVRTVLEDYRIWRKNNGFEFDDICKVNTRLNRGKNSH